jgi:hypothetical protein
VNVLMGERWGKGERKENINKNKNKYKNSL